MILQQSIFCDFMVYFCQNIRAEGYLMESVYFSLLGIFISWIIPYCQSTYVEALNTCTQLVNGNC